MLASQVKTDKNIKIDAIAYKSHKTPLSLQELYIPYDGESKVKPNEILVEIKATSINPVDVILKAYTYAWYGPKYKIMGGDFAGVVLEAGSETAYKPGDRVYGDVLDIGKRGSFSSKILVDPSKLVVCEKIPEGMSFEQAGSLGIVSNTAYKAMTKYKGDLKGKNVLVLGAGTSVGFFSTQFAKNYFGAANVVATCSSKSAAKTTKAGADLTIDYSKGDSSKLNSLLEFVKVNGYFDLIVDTVRDEFVIDHFSSLLKPAKEGGMFAQVSGSYVIDYSDIHFYNMLPSWKIIKNKLKFKLSLSKYPILPVWAEPDTEYGKAIEQLWNEGKLQIVLDSVYDAYKDYQIAANKVASCKAQGKVVLSWEQEQGDN
jgi:NADPH:quinone reductase-like Zn-dependent oxidoreductase